MSKTNVKTVARPLLLAALLLAVLGCLSKPYPERNNFALSLDLAGAPAARAGKAYNMVIGQINVTSLYETRSLVYKLDANRYETDFYNELVAPPARVLADQTARFLDAWNARVQVVRTPGIKLADFGLEAYIEDLYGDYSQPSPQAVATIKFTITDMRGDTPKVRLSKTYRRTAPIRAQNPADLVDGLSLCINQILAELNTDLSGLTGGRGKSKK